MKKLFFTLTLAFFAAACLQELPKAPKLEVEIPVAGSEEVWKAADYKDKPVLIAFMGTWCPWCKRTLPALDATSATFEGKAASFEGYVKQTGKQIKLHHELRLNKRVYEAGDWNDFRKAINLHKAYDNYFILKKRDK